MKGFKALENLCNQCEFYQFEKGLRPKKCPFNKNCVHKCRIEKELKALEIIKEKRVNVQALTDGMSLREYNDYCKYVWITPIINEEEYDLLKEVLYEK